MILKGPQRVQFWRDHGDNGGAPPADDAGDPPADDDDAGDPPGDDDGDDDDDDVEPQIKNPKAFLAKHRRMQKENARLKKERDEATAAAEKARKEKLKKDENYQTLAEEAEERARKAEQRAKEATERLVYAAKMQAFREALGPGVVLESKFAHLVDTDEIEVDEETGSLDPASIQRAVKAFKKEYPEVLKKVGNGGGMATDAPGDNAPKGKITWEQYNAMSPAERKKNYHRLPIGANA